MGFLQYENNPPSCQDLEGFGGLLFSFNIDLNSKFQFNNTMVVPHNNLLKPPQTLFTTARATLSAWLRCQGKKHRMLSK